MQQIVDLADPIQDSSAKILRLLGCFKNVQRRYAEPSLLNHTISTSDCPDHNGFATTFSLLNDNAMDDIVARLSRSLNPIEKL